MTRGIETIDDVKARCTVRGGHWLWNEGVSGGRPSAYLSLFKAHRSGMLITAMVLGRKKTAGHMWFAVCGQALCMAPKCCRHGTPQQVHAAASQGNRLVRSAATKATVRASRRRCKDVVPAELVRWALEFGQPSRATAHGLGISETTVQSWRRGRHLPPELTQGNPFLQLLSWQRGLP